VSLFGALFLISFHSIAKRDEKNKFIDRKAEELAKKQGDLVFLSKTILFAQQENWDSVLVNTQKLLQLPKDPELFDFIHYYRGEAFHKKGIFEYALREFDLVRRSFEFYTMVRFNKAGIFLSREKYAQALNLFKSIDTNDQKGIQIDALFHNTGVCYLHLGNYVEAEIHFLRAIQKIEKRKDYVSLISSYMDLANVYYEQYQDEKAIIYFEKAYLLSKKYGSNEMKQNAALNMAIVE